MAGSERELKLHPSLQVVKSLTDKTEKPKQTVSCREIIQILIQILKLSSLHLLRISRRAEPPKQGTSSVLILNEKNERCIKKRIVITITHDEKEADHFHFPDDQIQHFPEGWQH